MTIYDILKDSNYKAEQFEQDRIDDLNSRISTKTDSKGNPVPYVECLVRHKDIKLTPEEVVRQLLIDRLINTYSYPVSRMILEYPVHFGREVKRADIVIMDKDHPTVPYIIIEVKKPKLKVANLFESGIREPDIMLPFDLLENPSDLFVKKGTVLLSKDGSVGTAYKVDDNLNSITSSAILHLIVDEDKVDSDYLTLVLNSDIVHMQAERETNNAVIQHWTIDSVKKTIIPLVEKSIQTKLADLVKESKKLRKDSESLIKKAIKSMEIALLDGEEKALAYLETIN